MFTRDLSLEDCILDLIDNSMDAVLRTQGVDIEDEMLARGTGRRVTPRSKADIAVDYTEKRFTISDSCGGIPFAEAVSEVFCFGHSAGATKNRLGVYGVGLKRAIFKIGNNIVIESRTKTDGFRVEIDVEEWSKRDNTLDDWTFPVAQLNGKGGPKTPGTTITITNLRREVKGRINDGILESVLRKSIAQTYPFFLSRLADVRLNGTGVEERDLPFGHSSEVEPGIDQFEQYGVKVTLLATVAPKDRRTQDVAGWYVLCNGRVVVNADKSELTGWGAGLPAFHSKYLGFVGLVLFTAEDPELLPWTTSKRGLNREAMIFQLTRNRMVNVARPVTSFLNDMYPTDAPASVAERQIAETVVQGDFRPLLKSQSSVFSTSRVVTRKKATRVQFDATSAELDRIRKRLRRSGMAASTIGRFTFDHYLKTECAE
jgi:hypothetical protein